MKTIMFGCWLGFIVAPGIMAAAFREVVGAPQLNIGMMVGATGMWIVFLAWGRK